MYDYNNDGKISRKDVKIVFNGELKKDFIEYRGQDCIKFLGNTQPHTNTVNTNNYKVYYYMSEDRFNFNIHLRPLPDFCSVVFSAMTYALWTMPKRIFIVGADCSVGHANSLKAEHDADATKLVSIWKRMSSYIKEK